MFCCNKNHINFVRKTWSAFCGVEKIQNDVTFGEHVHIGVQGLAMLHIVCGRSIDTGYVYEQRVID